jgi:hypothetical protein
MVYVLVVSMVVNLVLLGVALLEGYVLIEFIGDERNKHPSENIRDFHMRRNHGSKAGQL